MTTLTKKPNRATQITGGFYQPFDHLDNVKNTVGGSYAVSKKAIEGKDGDKTIPSTVRVSDFRFNIPANAVVKRVTVYYRHQKRGVCDGAICKNAKHVCNIPKPTIQLEDEHNIWMKAKGKAPAKDNSTNENVVFNVLWDASRVNDKNFTVALEYPSNTNKHKGYVLLSFVYAKIDYFVPSFSVSCGSANSDKVYNNGEYHLRVSLSDANLTGRSANVNISVPLGWSYKDFKGNGNVVKVSNQSLVWYPEMRASGYSDFQESASAAFLELVFDVSVSFASGSDSYTGQFSAFLTGSSSPVTHNAVVYKPIPTQEETAPETPAPIDESEETVAIEWEKVTVNANISLNITPDELSKYSTRTLHVFPVNTNKELQFLEKNTDAYIYTKYEGGGSEEGWYDRYSGGGYIGWVKNNIFERNQIEYQNVRFTEIGLYCVLFYGGFNVAKNSDYHENSESVAQGTGEFYKYVYFMVIPDESSLTTPFMSILKPSDEECNRLGDGINYILQSNLQLTTEESYVRDWYRNFRIGVFNNKIEENCSTYYLQAGTETSFTGEIRLSSKYDITDGYLKIKSTDNPLTLIRNNNQYYQITTSNWTNVPLVEDYISIIEFAQDSKSICNLIIQQYTSDDTLVDTLYYRIQFNADEDIPLREVEVDSTDYNNLTQQEIFTNAEYWSDNIAGLNSMNEVTALFTYNKDYPLYILITGDYPEGAPTQNSIQYLEPCIIEEDEYEQRLQNGQYPVPIENTITYEDSSEIVLDAYNISDTIVFYDLPLDDNYGTDTEKAIRGIELVGNIEQSDRLTLYAKLKSPTGESRQRSIIINDYDTNLDSNNKFHIGGNGDLWGFNTLEITHLEDWEIEFSISNNLEETSSSINFNQIQLILYIETVQPQNITAYINGEDIRYYGVFLTDVNIPEGLQTETDYLKVDGTDTNDAYRQNITSKEITLEFDLGEDCDLEANTLSRREFAKLLVNDRDEYNRPIPKRIEFSHYPDVYWEYIMEEAIEDKIEIGSYTDGKVKLTIPSGTSYDKETTVTSNTGYVNGLATINPVIYVRPTDEVITVRETVTGQEFHIGYTGGWQNKILEIDCINKNVWLLENEEDNEPVNLNQYVDWNSSWFRLKGEYNFIGINCVVRTVEIRERW